MREGLEAELAMIGADPRCADAAERKILCDEMKERRIDRGASGDRPTQNLVALAWIGTEIIKRQRSRVTVDVVDCLFEPAISLDRQHRPENFLAHNGEVIAGVDDQ